jgi:hypothetical protein
MASLGIRGGWHEGTPIDLRGEMAHRIRKILLTVTLLVCAMPAAARAGRYHVYSCRMPSGAAAPVDGWSGSKTGTFTYVHDTCGEPGGALLAALGDQPVRTANTDVATWEFAAPAGETLAGATLWRAADADGGGAVNATYGAWFSAPLDRNDPADAFGQCTAGWQCPSGVGNRSQPLAPENMLSVPSSKLNTHIYATVSCFGEAEYECPAGQGDSNNYAAAVYLYAADLTLEQTAGPSVSAVGGELAAAPAVAGTTDLTFTASDSGSGVYAAQFILDGTPVQTTVLDEAGGHCRDVGQTTDGLPAFLYLQPCPSSVSADVGLDTARAGNGSHHLVVRVLDAAGNAAPVLDRMISVANPVASGGAGQAGAGAGAANGVGASAQATLTARWRRSARPTLTSTFGRRESVAGRLTGPGGAPIAAAEVEVSATPTFAGAASVRMRGARTHSNGSFSLTLPAHLSSRTLRITYRARAGEAQPAASRTLRLAVRAPVTLAIAPRTSHRGGTIRFSGRLLAGPIPRGGKPLILEARSGRGAWIQFHVVRTDGRGRYRSSYRFRFPGPARYRFRVVCEGEADYPFAPGSSPVLGVNER